MRSRRRSTPWIHRWSRVLIGAIAILGALLTAYLTISRLTAGEVVCLSNAGAQGSSTCKDVLSSPYATVFGLPLSLYGCLAYISMAAFAFAPLAIKSPEQKDLRSKLENWTWLLLFAGATAMTVFSGYLMYVLATQIQATCLYCIGSALFSLSLLVLTVIGHSWEDIGQLAFTALVVVMVTLISTLGVYANVNQTASDGGTIPPISGSPNPAVGGWEIKTTSGEAEIALAEHLSKTGFKMYGAYWCPHCHEQKALFGQEASSKLNYIECAPEGKNGQPNVCAQAGIKGFPSWGFNGKIESGVKPLDQLAKLSGYQGPQNFKYSLPGR